MHSKGPQRGDWGQSITTDGGNFLQYRYYLLCVMGCYSTQSELARHDSRAHVQQLTIFSTTPACFARHATRNVNITFPLTSSLKHNMNKQKETK